MKFKDSKAKKQIEAVEAKPSWITFWNFNFPQCTWKASSLTLATRNEHRCLLFFSSPASLQLLVSFLAASGSHAANVSVSSMATARSPVTVGVKIPVLQVLLLTDPVEKIPTICRLWTLSSPWRRGNTNFFSLWVNAVWSLSLFLGFCLSSFLSSLLLLSARFFIFCTNSGCSTIASKDKKKVIFLFWLHDNLSEKHPACWQKSWWKKKVK